MCKVLVFAGTIEGRTIAQFLAGGGVPVRACVATEYGEQIIGEEPGLAVTCGRLDQGEMEALIRESGCGLVVDATHPYAAIVTENIRAACGQTGVECLRLIRRADPLQGDYQVVGSVDEAVEYLKTTEGRVLLTTGSKELRKYTAVPDFAERLYPRILPTADVVGQCMEMGFPLKNLICMQGPFTEDMNVAMMRQIGAAYMVTKESGKSGGFGDKVAAAARAGAKLIVVGRPTSETGLTLEEMKRELARRFSISADESGDDIPQAPQEKRRVTLLGIGMGARENMTLEGWRACEEADAILGASRMLEVCAGLDKPTFAAYKNEELKAYIDEHPQYRRVVILLSGDIGFYSGAKKLIDCLSADYEVETLCGISSVVYFCGRLHISWEDVKLMSLHGKSGNLVAAVAGNRKVFSLIGGKEAVGQLCRQLTDYDLGDVMVHVGTRLSYPDEEIRSGLARELADQPIGGLCVVVIENPRAGELPLTHGLDDELFLRAKVPMTKSEVRSISLSKLQLYRDSVIYDVGAGTGSVSIEMALQAQDGYVYAVEKKEEACELIEANKRKFRAANLEVVRGLAPEALEDLPAPTHAFIGGSSGNLKEILELLLAKNPGVRVVINAIALETVSEALECMQTLPVRDVDIASVSIAKSRQLGRYHMMTGLNPIYIISCTGDAAEKDK